jgi:hypothetical protein
MDFGRPKTAKRFKEFGIMAQWATPVVVAFITERRAEMG